MMRRLALASALFVAVGSAAPSMAVAGTAISDFEIQASVQNNCTILANRLDFDIYNQTSGTSVTGTVTTNCTNGASAVITLGQGVFPANGSSNTAPSRRLHNGNGTYLSYTLYQNSGKTTIWGNSTDTGVTVLGNGSNKSTSVYGVIPPGQTAPSGAYVDSVTATVTY